MAKILIVEDIKIMSFRIKTILENLGHDVVAETSNGYDAIQQFIKFKPDIVTLDITMPAKNGIKDGLEALIEIKKINKDAIVIMLTSHGENKLVMQAISKGANGYILKPITEDKFKESFSKLGL